MITHRSFKQRASGFRLQGVLLLQGGEEVTAAGGQWMQCQFREPKNGRSLLFYWS